VFPGGHDFVPSGHRKVKEVLMQSSQGRQYRERDVVPRNLDAGQESSDQRNRRGMAPGESEYYTESPPVAPPSYAPARGLEVHPFANNRPSIGKRTFRTIARFYFAVLIGVCATLAWQSYGDQAKRKIEAWAPSLAWLLPVSAMEPAAAVATFPELVEQLKPISLDLAIVRRSLEQLAANQNQLAARQEQTAQNLATLQEVEQDVRQKMSFLPSSYAVHVPPRKPLSVSQPPLPAGQ
jgi:hypothetical protein